MLAQQVLVLTEPSLLGPEKLSLCEILEIIMNHGHANVLT